MQAAGEEPVLALAVDRPHASGAPVHAFRELEEAGCIAVGVQFMKRGSRQIRDPAAVVVEKERVGWPAAGHILEHVLQSERLGEIFVELAARQSPPGRPGIRMAAHAAGRDARKILDADRGGDHGISAGVLFVAEDIQPAWAGGAIGMEHGELP